MKYILLIIFSILLSNENTYSFSDTTKTFSKNQFSNKENIDDKYDSLYVRYNLLILEIYNIRQSLYDLQDSTKKIEKSIKYTANNLNSDIFKTIAEYNQGTKSDLVYSQQIMNEQDSINSSDLEDLEDRFSTFKSVQKLKNRKLDSRDYDFLDRLNELEEKINELESHLPKEDKK